MSFKTAFIILLTVLATVILMKNTDEVNFWIFGDTEVSKLVILGIMFASGFIVGVLVARPRKKLRVNNEEDNFPREASRPSSSLSDEDRDYISD